jgi:broad specificity phosphatase PhoE
MVFQKVRYGHERCKGFGFLNGGEVFEQDAPPETPIFTWEKIEDAIGGGVKFQVPIEFHLIRHAQTTMNAAGCITGSQDVDLTDYGRAQARLLPPQLAESYDLGFVSSLRRAQETYDLATTSARITAIREKIIDARLNERSLGILEGKKAHDIEAYIRGDLDYAPPEGETYRQVTQRVLSFLVDLVHQSYQQEISRILVCSHMGPMRIMIGALANITDPVDVLGLSFSNTQLVKFSVKEIHYPQFLN